MPDYPFIEHVAPLVRSQPPPLVMRFLRAAGKGINRHTMLAHGDRTLLSISGGKDSLALALALRLRLRFIPITYHLEAVLINWREYPHTTEALDAIGTYCDLLEIPFTVIEADMQPESFGGRFDCYRCGRNRRRILFEHVRHWGGTPSIATGHHLDDIVQTTLMNMFLRGSFSTMVPVQPFFDGALRVIRPLCEVREELIVAVAQGLHLPVSSIDCPYRTVNIRTQMAPLIAAAAQFAPGVRENIYRSHTNIDHEYLPRQSTQQTGDCESTDDAVQSHLP